jgi:hypothetical protein
MTEAAFRKLALSFAGAHEKPHFDRASFRTKKGIFATLKSGKEAMIVVRPVDKALALIEALPQQFFSYGGWTTKLGSLGVRLPAADPTLLGQLMREAWARVRAKPKRQSFTGVVREGHEGTAVEVPFDPAIVYGVKAKALSAGRRGFAVQATVNGEAIAGVIAARSNKHWLLLDGVTPGSRVRVVITDCET